MLIPTDHRGPMRKTSRRVAMTVRLILLIAVSGCDGSDDGAPLPATAPAPPTSSSEPWFQEVTEAKRLTFVHDVGPTGSYFFPQTVGSGAALFDFDNDGRLDIYLVQNAGPDSGSTNRLFHQKPDGTFEDVSKGSGTDVAGYGMGAAAGDVNNDGRADLLVTEFARVRLLLNEGGGRFSDVTPAAGVDNPHWAVSACFFDYDRDGWLDLVVANYVNFNPSTRCTDNNGRPEFCGPSSFEGSVAKLFRNTTARRGRPAFEDVTVSSGLASRPERGLGVFCADFTGDYWPDIFVTNDGRPNHLWVNRHDGTFAEEAVERGIAYNRMGQAEANMGIAFGDPNRDGLLDVFVTHLTEENPTLWRQGPPGAFDDRTAESGVIRTHWRGTGFGAVFGDFNRDGHADLAVTNGRVRRGMSTTPPAAAVQAVGEFWAHYADRNQLFAGGPGGKLTDVSPENPPFSGGYVVGRGLATGDIDNDGAVDLLVTGIGAPARLYRNVAPSGGHWLTIRAIDPALKRDAYGAEVTVHAGDQRWTAWLNPGGSYACSNDPRVHLGLGDATRVERIQIRWPDGTLEEFGAMPTDQAVTLEKGNGHPSTPEPPPSGAREVRTPATMPHN